MKTSISVLRNRRHLASITTLVIAALASLASVSTGTAQAAEPPRAIEQTLATAQQDKKGVMLLIGGQQLGGGVTRIEPGQWVELKNQQYGRIVVRIDRIDAVMMP